MKLYRFIKTNFQLNKEEIRLLIQNFKVGFFMMIAIMFGLFLLITAGVQGLGAILQYL